MMIMGYAVQYYFFLQIDEIDAKNEEKNEEKKIKTIKFLIVEIEMCLL